MTHGMGAKARLHSLQIAYARAFALSVVALLPPPEFDLVVPDTQDKLTRSTGCETRPRAPSLRTAAKLWRSRSTSRHCRCIFSEMIYTLGGCFSSCLLTTTYFATQFAALLIASLRDDLPIHSTRAHSRHLPFWEATPLEQKCRHGNQAKFLVLCVLECIDDRVRYVQAPVLCVQSCGTLGVRRHHVRHCPIDVSLIMKSGMLILRPTFDGHCVINARRPTTRTSLFLTNFHLQRNTVKGQAGSGGSGVHCGRRTELV